MHEVKVRVGNEVYIYKFESQPTEQEINDAMNTVKDTIGGRPKRD